MSRTAVKSASSELLAIVREKLLHIERACGLPRREFAQEVLGVAEKTYYNICVGTARIDLKMLDRMARNLGISARVLVDAAPMPEKFEVPAIDAGRPREGSKKVGIVKARDRARELAA